ncbi:hypothetical protein [Streptomyces sp. NBC_00564]|uniref:hypothetical protein n=1 Tax=unclassified Streptomyces TaxID=2593676 RepID=UPI00324DB969|nr:hypothetical protein OG256_12270 [Streptomyces sp. NBC_00564]
MRTLWTYVTRIAAVSCTIAAGVAFAPPAQAADYGCSGSLIETLSVKTLDGTKYGELKVYYSSANGGTNCAVTVDTRFSGTFKHMDAWVARCATNSTVSLCNWDKADPDSGTYQYYAGPVSITQTASRCIRAEGWIENPTTGTDAYATLPRSHCA